MGQAGQAIGKEPEQLRVSGGGRAREWVGTLWPKAGYRCRSSPWSEEEGKIAAVVGVRVHAAINRRSSDEP